MARPAIWLLIPAFLEKKPEKNFEKEPPDLAILECKSLGHFITTIHPTTAQCGHDDCFVIVLIVNALCTIGTSQYSPFTEMYLPVCRRTEPIFPITRKLAIDRSTTIIYFEI
uniref:Uncharacterized protein n=1 Tax=Globodera rostochiensis TaxID=31243 RepID=A0A914HR09_GLORO